MTLGSSKRRRSSSRRRFYFVEMINLTDRQDDEVWKVRASNKEAARVIANSSTIGKFVAGHIVPINGGTRGEKALAREFKTYCTRQFP